MRGRHTTRPMGYCFVSCEGRKKGGKVTNTINDHDARPEKKAAPPRRNEQSGEHEWYKEPERYVEDDARNDVEAERCTSNGSWETQRIVGRGGVVHS